MLGSRLILGVLTAAFLLLVVKIYSDSSFGHLSYSDLQITPAAPAPQGTGTPLTTAIPAPSKAAEKPVEKKPDEKEPEEKKPEEKKPEEKKPEEEKKPKKPSAQQQATWDDRDKEEAYTGDPEYFKNKPEWNWEAPLKPNLDVKPENILILTAGNGKGHNAAIPNVMEKTVADREAYAKRHGYTHLHINTDQYYVGDVHPVWAKMPALADAFYRNPKIEWIWVIDSDIIIVSHNVKLEDLVLSQKAMSEKILRNQTLYNGMRDDHTHKTPVNMPANPKIEDLDILITQDHNGVNGGSIFYRRSYFTRFFMEAWTDKLLMESHWAGKEQDAIKHLMLEHPLIREHVGVFPQRLFNAYPVGGENMGWHEGDLIVHLAGCWVRGDQVCVERFDEYWAKRKLD